MKLEKKRNKEFLISLVLALIAAMYMGSCVPQESPPCDFPNETEYYCRVVNPFSLSDECHAFIGESDWNETSAQEQCDNAYSSAAGTLSTEPCECPADGSLIGNCLIPVQTKMYIRVFYMGGLFETGQASPGMIEGICESSWGGIWTPGDAQPVIPESGLMQEAYDAMVSNADVAVTPECIDTQDEVTGEIPCLDALTDSNGYIKFTPNTGVLPTGLIIYPGAGVDPRAYAVAAQRLAKQGYQVFIVPMPDNFAITNYTRADNVISENNTSITNWFIAGHSMGGAAAARYVNDDSTAHSSDIQGLILWGSYVNPSQEAPDLDLSGLTAPPVMSIFGTRDGISTVEEINDNKQYLPAGTQYIDLLGGNHSQFGYYGFQIGDNDAGIDREHQHTLYTDATMYMIKSVLEGPTTVDPAILNSVANKESTWPADVQIILGNVDSSFEVNDINIVSYDLKSGSGSFVESKPAIETDGTVTVRSYILQYGNPDNLSLPPVYSGEFWVKSKLQDTLVSELGYTAQGDRGTCSDVNQNIIDWAFGQTGGNPVYPALVHTSYPTGGEWVPSLLTFGDVGGTLTLDSPYLEVEPDDPLAPEGGDGVIYCKIWSPARAIRWALFGE